MGLYFDTDDQRPKYANPSCPSAPLVNCKLYSGVLRTPSNAYVPVRVDKNNQLKGLPYDIMLTRPTVGLMVSSPLSQTYHLKRLHCIGGNENQQEGGREINGLEVF